MAEGPEPGAVEALLAEAGIEAAAPRLTELSGGASRELYLVEAAAGERWVLRRDPPGAESFLPLAVEHRLLAAAAAAGVPVPRPLAFAEPGAALGSAAMLMEHVAGETVAPRVLKRDELAAARAALPAQLGAALARVHAIDPAPIEGVSVPDGDPALAACELWEAELDRVGEPLPALEAGLRWLRLHPPPPADRPVLVHGDFRLGNFIVDGEGLAAVIDWELAHGGDPAEDIGWLTIRSWRFGNDELPVAGLASLEPFLAAYGEAGGVVPAAESLRWWEAMGNVKWAVICARQAKDHLEGVRPSHELASLGRRICEPEWDLLALLGELRESGARGGSAATTGTPSSEEAD